MYLQSSCSAEIVNYCVLIPVLNEERFLGPIIKGLKARGVEVLVIDDGSSDQSAAIARKEGADVIVHEQRMGKGYTLQTGLRVLLEKKYDNIVGKINLNKPMDSKLRNQLIEYFKPHNEKLYKFLGKNFDWDR